MAYTLIIGEKATDSNEYESWVTAEVVRRNDAPAYGEVTGHTNQRFVSGSTWWHSMEVLGLTDVMYGNGNDDGTFIRGQQRHQGLMREHPGFTIITTAHVDIVERALAKYREAYPDNVPGYSSGEDSALLRGEWLVYWLRWAIDNCQCPVFVNR